MNSLILDCSAGLNVILLKDDEEFLFVDESKQKHSDDLLVVIDDLLKKAKLEIKQIDNICVCVGPGSFTGVRVAISVCKGLAIGTGANIYTLSNFDIFEYENCEDLIFVLDGFSDFVYVRILENDNKRDYCIKISALKEKLINKNYTIYVENEKVQNKLKLIEINSKIAIKNTKNAFLYKINNNEKVELNEILPIYLRASQAEIERNKKLNGENNE